MSCNGQCVDIKSNISNCGACGKVCPSGQSCNNGVCGYPTGTNAGAIQKTGEKRYRHYH